MTHPPTQLRKFGQNYREVTIVTSLLLCAVARAVADVAIALL